MKKAGLSLLALTLAALLALSGCAVQEPPAASAAPPSTGTGTALSDSTTDTGATEPESTTASATTKATKAPLKTQGGAVGIVTAIKPSAQTTDTSAPAAEIDKSLTEPTNKTEPPSTDIRDEEKLNQALTPIPVSDYYGRRQLAGEPKLLEAYKRIASAAEKGSEEILSISDLGLNLAQVTKAFDYYRADFPQHFWSYNLRYGPNDEKVNVIKLVYSMQPSDIPQARQAFQDAAAKALKGIDGSMTPYERELYIHDYLVKNIVYDTTKAKADIHNLYGALVNRTAVCDGYARAFQYLLYQAGIPALYVTGDSQGEGHAWSMAKIGDDWYYVDVTWDDPVCSGVTESNKPLFYGYFNVTKEQLLRDHTIGKDNYPLPDAVASTYNYYTLNGGRVATFRAEEVAPLIQPGTDVHLYVDGDMPAYYSAMYAGWNDVRRLSGVGRPVLFFPAGQEIIIRIQ